MSNAEHRKSQETSLLSVYLFLSYLTSILLLSQPRTQDYLPIRSDLLCKRRMKL